MSEAISEFGCALCYGEDAREAWERQGDGFEREAEVVDDSHFSVAVRRCRACAQRFVWIFTEFIDWRGGDDAQYNTIMPLTDAEAAGLVSGSLRPLDLGALGHNRRHLNQDWPSGGPARLGWKTGPFMVREGG
ncbi:MULTISPECIES: hypothetical protein [unclassified Kitasatospora]|uniref:hypothetical protein n=1 Tax=unclassified Kitasatospora TaxID=2633591 RepID=UPI0033CFE6C4